MKKVSLLVVALIFSGAAAAETQLASSGQLRLGDCPTPGPLSEDVRITLTTGVVAGFDCNATRVVMSACHTAGRVTSRSAYVNIPADCDPGQTDNTAADFCTSTNVPEGVSGPAFPTANSLTGTVSVRYPTADTAGCTAGAARGYAAAQP
jgi:hypothetical protein